MRGFAILGAPHKNKYEGTGAEQNRVTPFGDIVASPVPGAPEDSSVRRVSPLVAEAVGAGQLPQFVDALTAGLASIIFRHGIWAAGDVLRHLGEHLCRITNERLAEKEAEEEREAGRAPY